MLLVPISVKNKKTLVPKPSRDPQDLGKISVIQLLPSAMKRWMVCEAHYCRELPGPAEQTSSSKLIIDQRKHVRIIKGKDLERLRSNRQPGSDKGIIQL